MRTYTTSKENQPQIGLPTYRSLPRTDAHGVETKLHGGQCEFERKQSFRFKIPKHPEEPL